MNRDIIFRAKCFGNWRYGSYLHFEKKPINSHLNINYKDFIVTNEEDGEHYYPITELSSLGQYTGLKDKNGKEIYEGDILITGSTSNLTVEVVYNEEDTSFILKLTSINTVSARTLGSWLSLGYECAIIGSVYDTPKLIK
jgi:uncharacterized phage protein (TIGR01671 family)